MKKSVGVLVLNGTSMTYMFMFMYVFAGLVNIGHAKKPQEYQDRLCLRFVVGGPGPEARVGVEIHGVHALLQ